MAPRNRRTDPTLTPDYQPKPPIGNSLTAPFANRTFVTTTQPAAKSRERALYGDRVHNAGMCIRQEDSEGKEVKRDWGTYCQCNCTKCFQNSRAGAKCICRYCPCRQVQDSTTFDLQMIAVKGDQRTKREAREEKVRVKTPTEVNWSG